MSWRLIGLAFLALAGVAHAGSALVYAKLGLVQSLCGQTTFAPCSPAFAFRSGTVLLNGSREPKATCPKTHQPSESPAGSVKLIGVTKNGAAFTGTLPAEVVLKTTFGADPSGACSLHDLQFTLPSLVGSVQCRGGRCKGLLLPIQCLEAGCMHTAITTELVSIVIRDDSGNQDAVIAAPGTVLAAQR